MNFRFSRSPQTNRNDSMTIQHPPDTRTDYRYGQDSRHLTRSVMRELLKKASAPGVISLAGGLPDTRLLPAEQYRECLDAVLTRDGGAALQYRPMHEPLREWIASLMQLRGVRCDAQNVFVTNGNQQGLSVLSRLFLDPDAPAVTEAITFTGIQQVTAGRGARMLLAPTDLESGVDVDALESLFAEYQPRLAVLVPDFHNPLGVSISSDKRQRIAEAAARYQVPVIEDDPYSALRFAGRAAPPIKAYDEHDWVFYLGSFSKMLAPGLRMGWMLVPDALVPRISALRESFDLETSTLTQRAVAEFVTRGHLEPHLERLNATNRARCTAMLEALDRHFGAFATWTQPEGGLFVWVTLPDGIDTTALLADTIDTLGVAYVPGGAFAVDGRSHRNTLRLNFSAVAPDDIRKGIVRLADRFRPLI
jgi:2-aminoadipate transaminase